MRKLKQAAGGLLITVLGAVLVGFFNGSIFVPARVPNYIGMNLDDATRISLPTQIETEKTGVPGQDKVVLGQSPAPGTLIWYKTSIHLTYGQGSPQIPQQPRDPLELHLISLEPGRRIEVVVPQTMKLRVSDVPPTIQAWLSAPLVAGQTVVAPSTSKVVLWTKRSLAEGKATIAVSVREIVTTDGRPVYAKTDSQEIAAEIDEKGAQQRLSRALTVGLVTGLLIEVVLAILTMGFSLLGCLVLGILIGTYAGTMAYNRPAPEELSVTLQEGKTLIFRLQEPVLLDVPRQPGESRKSKLSQK